MHITTPDSAGQARAMRAALDDAELNPADIGYINAHGTGTPLNDSAEAAAIGRWAGADAGRVLVSSTKGCIGHLLGAAGAVEAVVCLMALRGQWLPPGRSVDVADPACGFPLVPGPSDASFEYALSNSFGFGGANATLVFRRWA
jgi:3-oxoacyl-[acyl-carrier-protein] synthase II